MNAVASYNRYSERIVGNSERGLRDGGRLTVAIPGEESQRTSKLPRRPVEVEVGPRKCTGLVRSLDRTNEKLV